MFYSEKFQSPINSYNVKRLYGVNPDTEPDRALVTGIYPLIECSEGYTATHYAKEGNAYCAVPSDVSNAEKALVCRVREAKMSMKEAAENLKLPETADLVDEPPKKNGRKKKA